MSQKNEIIELTKKMALYQQNASDDAKVLKSVPLTKEQRKQFDEQYKVITDAANCILKGFSMQQKFWAEVELASDEYRNKRVNQAEGTIEVIDDKDEDDE